MNRIQAKLSIMQAIPIVGPMVYSPAKAMVSAAQVVVGLAKTVFYTMLMPLVVGFGSDREVCENVDDLIEGLHHVIWGTIGLQYSIINMGTLGIAGFFIEMVFPFNRAVVLIPINTK